MADLFGTSFAQTGFSYEPNLSPNNRQFSLAVRAVTKALGLSTGGGGGTGSVTSVSGTDASTQQIFGISGVPITTSGTFTMTLINQSANQFFAGPASGAAAQPTFRAIVAGDVPHFISFAFDQVFYAQAGGF